ncbi:MATE family efflux transporter [Facklamia languida]|uniref:Probable multidrug resistance protein NorM n=1 Tax=Facklamia languida CCUG 37842 TaxID=883113 RepID=H3NIE8_9LACT|nr:MATE family efflux transporter [Facklamia languida]EHR37458.1 MATE efflux family protein [Facklamia languida CCUG 37842]
MNTKNDFYKEMLAIAIPIALQNLIVSSLNTLDTMMISTLGASTIAGVGLANQVFFFFMMICFGTGTGSSVMISQYYGRRDYENMRRVNALSAIICMVTGAVFTLLAFTMPERLIRLLIDDPIVINEGAKYLRVVCWSYILTGFSFACGISQRSTGNPRAPLVGSIIGFICNAFFNYAFIFGKFGMPELGVVGAAVGTIIARFAESGIILYSMTRYSSPLRGPIRDMMNFGNGFITKFMKVTFPVIVNETLWGLGQVLYSVAYAKVGTDATAAVQIVVAIQNLAFVLIRGLSNSCTIIIGKTIGQGLLQMVYPYAIRFLKLGTLFSVAIGLFMCLTPDLTLSLFGSLSPEVRLLCEILLVYMGILFMFKAFNSVLVVGVLRGGGDTTFSLFLETGSVWLVGVPLAFIGAVVFQLPIQWVVVLAGMEEVVKLFIGVYRVYSRKWIHEIA